MSETTRNRGRWAMVVAALGILTVGASTAMAASAATACANDGWNTLGWQPSAAVCQDACEAVHYPGVDYRYDANGCCRCLY